MRGVVTSYCTSSTGYNNRARHVAIVKIMCIKRTEERRIEKVNSSRWSEKVAGGMAAVGSSAAVWSWDCDSLRLIGEHGRKEERHTESPESPPYRWQYNTSLRLPDYHGQSTVNEIATVSTTATLHRENANDMKLKVRLTVRRQRVSLQNRQRKLRSSHGRP
ncbi:hypothetical protein C8039_12590 [Halogeometricum sp. wsp3]|nr:hypothetical protein C8039_12590 [Halogeometricum sp. wsp3]